MAEAATCGVEHCRYPHEDFHTFVDGAWCAQAYSATPREHSQGHESLLICRDRDEVTVKAEFGEHGAAVVLPVDVFDRLVRQSSEGWPMPDTESLNGPWGNEEGTIGFYRVCDDDGACVRSALEALTEHVTLHEDDLLHDYALSVEGPLIYHAADYGSDERIEPCECDDEHPDQIEVWKVVAQQQEPSARAQERRRWQRVFDLVADDHQKLAKQLHDDAMQAYRDGNDRLYRGRMDSGKTHRSLADTYYRVARRLESNDD